jgi:hypothetical protein
MGKTGDTVLVVWVEFKHRLETRPFVGVGETQEQAIEDAVDVADRYWGLNGTRMSLQAKHLWDITDVSPQDMEGESVSG